MAQHLLGAKQMVVVLPAEGELDREGFGRQRLDTIIPNRDSFILKYP